MNQRLVRRIVWAVSFLGLGRTLWSEDIVPASGKVLNNARIIALDTEGVMIQYDGGTEKFALSAILSSIDVNWRGDFGFPSPRRTRWQR